MKRLVIAVLMAVAFSGMCLADGDGPSRAVTPAETSFFTTTYQTVTELLPPAATGQERKFEEWKAPTTVSVGAENRPLRLEVRGEYHLIATTTEFGAILSDGQGIEDMATKMQAVSQKLEAAIAKGDQAEMARVQAEMQAVMQTNPVMKKLQGAAKNVEMQKVLVSVRINDHGVFDSTLQEIAAPAPGVIALRREESSPAMANAPHPVTTCLYFGSFTRSNEGNTIRLKAASEEGTSTKIHRLAVSIEAFPKTADEFIARLDLKKIAELVR